MKRKLLFLLLVFSLALSACSPNKKDEDKKVENKKEETGKDQKGEKREMVKLNQEEGYKQGNVKVTMKTTMGDIKFILFPDAAPKTVENFVTHAKNGYYEGVIFHRVIEGFMIQGGDPTGTGRGGESIYGAPFEDEISVYHRNFYGALSMANAGPKTNGSQFFIVTTNSIDSSIISKMKEAGAENGYPDEVINFYEKVGGAFHLDGKHTVFGHVVEGMDVVLKISKVQRNAQDRPLEDVKIEKVIVE